MPPVHPWSAEGMETPILIVSCAIAEPQTRLAAYKDTTTICFVRVIMFILGGFQSYRVLLLRCNRAAPRIMMPCTAPLRYTLIMFVRLRMFPIIVKIRAPIIDPETRPVPPRSAVPPTTTAVIASSSQRTPVEEDADPSRGT